MNANLIDNEAARRAPPDATVTTVFLKPSFGITVQSNTLCVSVKARTEGAAHHPSARARLTGRSRVPISPPP